MNDVTQLLNALERGDPQAASQLLPLVYEELRKLAAQKMSQETPGQTLQPTALVHDAYLRLIGPGSGSEPAWQGRGHFFAAAAEAMRRILIDNARRKQTEKHGGGRRCIPLEDAQAFFQSPDDLLALDDALDTLAADDAIAAEIVKLRVFAGLSVEDAAQALGLGRATAYRHWTFGRAWLRCELGDEEKAEDVVPRP